MKSILFQNLKRIWFEPIAAERLAIIRIITGVFSLWYLSTRYDMMVRMFSGEPALFDPIGLLYIMDKPLPVVGFIALLWLTLGLNVMYILGWQFKKVGPLFGVFLLILMTYRNSWSMIYHNYNILILHVFVIGFSPATVAISIDAWAQDKISWWKRKKVSWKFGWPIKLIGALTVITYLLSGLAKLFGDLAWAWVSGSAMRSQVAIDAIRKVLLGAEASPLFEYLYPEIGLFLLMGIIAMIVEMAAPFALFNRKIGISWAILACFMHWGIYFMMGIKFPYHMSGMIFLSFFAVERLWFTFSDVYEAEVEKIEAIFQMEKS